MDDKLIGVVSGLLMMGYFVSGLFFLRFWKSSKDRLFLYFAAAFWLLAFQRIILIFAVDELELGTVPYLLRLIAFLLILFAIYDKNRGAAAAA